jgi:TonB family protein
MKKSLFLSALLHFVLITIFFFLPFAVDLSKKNKAIALTFGPPDATSQKTASEEKESESSKKPDNEITQAPEKPKSEVSNLPAELPADIIPPVQSAASTPAVPMQTSANTQPEASPEVYGSMGLDSYYYNKPMEAYSPLPTTKSPAKKPQQQYAIKMSMQSSPTIPMQKPSMMLTQSIPTITVSIIKNMKNADTVPLETTPNTIESTYVQGIQQTIEQSKTYPEEAQAGTVKIKFKIGKDGTLIKIEIMESSGSETLDAAGAALLKKIEKFQPVPDILKKEFMDIILNINYK